MVSKRSQKKLKKLGNWIGQLRAYPLFEIGRNATHSIRKIMKLPIAAALGNSSIEHVSSLEGRISADDFYYHANNKLTEVEVSKMIHRYCAEIVKMIVNLKRTNQFNIAIDYTEDPYYGETENPFVTGGKRKASTNYGFKWLTVALVNKEVRFVLFAYPIRKTDNADAPLVEKGLRAVWRLGVHILRALLDREFYNEDIIAMLKLLEIEFIIPSKKDEKFERMLHAMIEQKKRDGIKPQFPFIFDGYQIGKETVTQVVFEEINSNGEKEYHAYITNRKLSAIKEDPYAVQEDYSERWAIENANKYQDAFNIHTSCTNGIVRFFFFALTLLLHNFWVLVNFFTSGFGKMARLPLEIFKEMIMVLFGMAPMPRYKQTQRKLWVVVFRALLNV